MELFICYQTLGSHCISLWSIYYHRCYDFFTLRLFHTLLLGACTCYVCESIQNYWKEPQGIGFDVSINTWLSEQACRSIFHYIFMPRFHFSVVTLFPVLHIIHAEMNYLDVIKTNIVSRALWWPDPSLNSWVINLFRPGLRSPWQASTWPMTPFNPFMPVVPKTPYYFSVIFLNREYFRKWFSEPNPPLLV